MMRKYLIILIFTSLPFAAAAQCENVIAGSGCHVPPVRTVVPKDLGPPPVEIGEILESGRYSMVLNARYYGLPDVKDGWVYFRIEDDVYRVDWVTLEVLERVTDQASANWP